MDILEKINSQIEAITEVDIESWLIDGIIELYKPRIIFWAKKVENNFENLPDLAIKAFTEEIKTRLIASANTFIIKKQHWKNTKYSLNTYLLSTIKNFAKEKQWLNECAAKSSVLICPACKLSNNKSFLFPENGSWRCSVCSESRDQILKTLKSDNQLDEKTKSRMQARYRLYNVFSLHSRKGFKCPDCNGFIPESSVGKYGATCPYENCSFSGNVKLEIARHPASITTKKNLSLLATTYNLLGTSKMSIQDRISDNSQMADTSLLVNDSYNKEYKILQDVISNQIDSINRLGTENTRIKKLLMYKAYKNMIEQYPEEMMAYLVHLKNNHDFPIQSKIFQEYVCLIENYLPFSINKNGKNIDICSLTDPNLALFLGRSEYKAIIDNSFVIPNNTTEVYVGKRKFKNYGPCFIGRLIDVIDETTNLSILGHVKEYNFVQINLDNLIKPNTPVIVSHFRIPSHYEMGSLVFLQRIRRQIVDSVYFHLNNKKRPLKA
jgi:uncharacterized protein YaaR (DUF327 family)